MPEEPRSGENPLHPPVEGPESDLGASREHEELAALREEVAAARGERDDAREKLSRALADFENFRRRSRGEAQAAREKGKEEVLRGLLDLVDSFDRAVAAAGVGVDGDGLRLLHRLLSSLLEREGLARMETVGQAFDPALHEAVAREPSADVKEGVIVGEVARGYAMGGRVVRPARVRVSSGPALPE